jgi:hypothetical protein
MPPGDDAGTDIIFADWLIRVRIVDLLDVTVTAASNPSWTVAVVHIESTTMFESTVDSNPSAFEQGIMSLW